MVREVTKQYYGIKIGTILNGIEKLTADVEYLSSMVEQPDPEFTVSNAVVYAHALSALANQLSFFIEDLTDKDLSDDGEYVKVSHEEVLMMNAHNEAAEEALFILEETCGISLQNN